MGNSHSLPTLPSRMSDLPWQDGHYKCSNINMFMGADMVMVKGNTVYGSGFVTPKLTAGEFGKAADEVVAMTGKTEYNAMSR